MFAGHRVLVIDPASTSGYCILQHYQDSTKKWDFQKNSFGGVCEIGKPEYFSIKAGKEGDHTGHSCNQIYDFFKKIILKEEITMVAMEDYVFSRFAKQGAKLNVAIRAALQMLCSSLQIPYLIIPISLWKRSVSGRGSASKEDKLKWKTKANKMFIVESLTKDYGLKFPEKVANQKGKMVKFKYDLSDVLGQAICVTKVFFNSKVEFIFQW